jgi:hypothetical protein
MVTLQHKRAIGTFSDSADAEASLRELKDSGFPMNMVSIVGQDLDRNSNMIGAEGSDRLSDLGQHIKADGGAKTGAATGGAVGGLMGLLVGLGMVAVPGVGPILLAGEAVSVLATAAVGGVIGAAGGGIVGGLVGMGIPEDRATTYSDRVDRGDYLIMVEGSDEDIHRAQNILSHRGINDWGVYDINSDVRTKPSAMASTNLG